jgi:hypothetical protein
VLRQEWGKNADEYLNHEIMAEAGDNLWAFALENFKAFHECEPEPTEEEVRRNWKKLALRKLVLYSIGGAAISVASDLFSGRRVSFLDVLLLLANWAIFLGFVVPVFVAISIPILHREFRGWACRVRQEWKDWKRALVRDYNKRLRETGLRELRWQNTQEGQRQAAAHRDSADPDSPDFGAGNVIFTRERAEAARARLLEKLGAKEAGEHSGEGTPEGDRQLTRLEQHLMLALGLENVHELDELLAKPPDPTVELENGPPDEAYELLEKEYAEQDRALEKEQRSKARTRKPR